MAWSLLVVALLFMMWGALRGNFFQFTWAVIGSVLAATAIRRQQQA